MSKNPLIPISLLVISFLTASTIPAVALSASPELVSYINRDWSDNQWHLSASRINNAWNVSTGEGTVVAVIDTGVDAGHPDLSGQVLDGYEFSVELDPEGNSLGTTLSNVAKENMTDEYGHGTHVAGLIAAKDNGNGVIGVAPDSKILPIKVFDLLANGNFQDVFFGLRDAVNLAVENNADVINMSLGMPSFEKDANTTIGNTGQAYIEAEEALCDAITNAKENGVVTVVAAGNDGLSGNYASAPSTCDDAVSVAAIDVNNQATFFSNYDVTVDIAAPGYDILSTLSRKTSPVFKYGQMSGTSMAAPITAGAFAVVKSAFPEDNLDSIISRVYESAVDAGVTGQDASYGHGLLDLGAAVGFNESRNSAPDSKKFVANVRYAFNEDYNSFAATWNQPLGSSLPDHYVVKIYDRYGSLYSTNNVAGNQVRYIFEIPERFKYSFWTVVEAVYADSSMMAPAIFRQGNPVALTSPWIDSLTNDNGELTSATLSWSPIDALEADYIVYGYSGLQFVNGYEVFAALPDENGDIDSSVTMNFEDANLNQNVGISDFDVNFFAKSITENDMSMSDDEIVYFVHQGASPVALAVNAFESSKINNTFAINNSQREIACSQAVGGDCSQARFQVAYTVVSKSGKKTISKTYKVNIKGTSADYTDEITGKTIYTFSTKSPFKMAKTIKSVNVKVSILKANGKIGNSVLENTYLIKNGSILERNIAI